MAKINKGLKMIQNNYIRFCSESLYSFLMAIHYTKLKDTDTAKYYFENRTRYNELANNNIKVLADFAQASILHNDFILTLNKLDRKAAKIARLRFIKFLKYIKNRSV